jgi:uncharacterized protein YdhG (YjbR/CyaY superfamily)
MQHAQLSTKWLNIAGRPVRGRESALKTKARSVLYRRAVHRLDRTERTMAERRAKKVPKKAAGKTGSANEGSKAFSAEERAAMRERAKELKASAGKAEDERAVVARIAEMPQPDRGMAERLHAIVKASAPNLSPKLWYGMPAYARDGEVVCFFQNAQKFKTRYSTLGFSDKAMIDEGNVWPTSFALKELTAADEARIGGLVKKAAS